LHGSLGSSGVETLVIEGESLKAANDIMGEGTSLVKKQVEECKE
jgi:hypothetical protein